jgi:hypothetical protein
MLSYYEKIGNTITLPKYKIDIDEIINKEKKQIHLVKARDRSNTFNFKNTVFSYKPEEKQINIPKNNPLASMGKQFNKFDLYNK